MQKDKRHKLALALHIICPRSLISQGTRHKNAGIPTQSKWPIVRGNRAGSPHDKKEKMSACLRLSFWGRMLVQELPFKDPSHHLTPLAGC